ncbi:Protein-S-isoprenylcysteine O-methyltransferase [Abortiporus biennis]
MEGLLQTIFELYRKPRSTSGFEIPDSTTGSSSIAAWIQGKHDSLGVYYSNSDILRGKLLLFIKASVDGTLHHKHSSSISPIMTYSRLVKIPFILLNAVLIRKGALPPTPPPSKDELDKYQGECRDSMGQNGGVQAARILQIITNILFALEIYAILSLEYPTLRLPTYLHSFICNPFSSHEASVFAIDITPTFIVGSIVAQTGALCRLLCYHYLGRQFTFVLTVRKEHKLITDGPYSIVRHPSYTAIAIMFSGLFILTTGSGSYANSCGLLDAKIDLMDRVFPLGNVLRTIWGLIWSSIVVLLACRIPKEDMVMKHEFKGQWEEWAKKTPYALVPFFY